MPQKRCQPRGFHPLLQFIETDRPQILLGGREVLVPEQHLQRLDVDPRLQHVRRESVPPFVQEPVLAARGAAALAPCGRAEATVQFCPEGDLLTQFG